MVVLPPNPFFAFHHAPPEVVRSRENAAQADRAGPRQDQRPGHYLGPYGPPEAEERYKRLVAELLTTGGLPTDRPAGTPAPGLSVNEVILAYVTFARGYYVKDGKPTSELPLVRDALRLLREHYGTTPAAEFGPLRLKALRETLVARGICRKSVNQRIGRIKRLFKWGVENELAPAAVHRGLSAVAGLRLGRSEAKESDPVGPVADADVNAVLPHMNRQVAAMVKLQVFTGCRPGEACSLRPCDVNRDAEVWECRPRSHKTAHHGRERVVYLGPRAQWLLGPWLDDRPAGAFCFSPAEAVAERSAARRVVRRSQVQPSQRDRRAKRPRKSPGDRDTTMSCGKSIVTACRKAGVSPWSPNRLRRSAASAIRKGFGLEAAQVSLGHASADVTQVYAERDADLARRVAAEIG